MEYTEDCKKCDGTGWDKETEYDLCEHCDNGTVLTEQGEKLKDFLNYLGLGTVKVGKL